MATCKIDHTGQIPDKIAKLPESQAGNWRHRCAACAYLQGVEDERRRQAGVKGAQKRLRLHVAH